MLSKGMAKVTGGKQGRGLTSTCSGLDPQRCDLSPTWPKTITPNTNGKSLKNGNYDFSNLEAPNAQKSTFSLALA